MRKDTYHGFSLVELSIVLVILGLLVGGVLAGQSLIRAAELRATNTEFQRYATAYAAFRDKYLAIPGDMPNATAFWGINGDATTCKTTASTTSATCNGNGDGGIDFGADAADVSQVHERFSAWKHLSNAGLIEGAYTGVPGPDGPRDVVIGGNSPRSRLTNAGWSAAMRTSAISDTNWYLARAGNFLLFGGETGTAANWGGVLKPEEAWNIDVKMDDGRPSYGRIVSLKPAPSTLMPNCATNATEASAEYALTNATLACGLIQYLPF